MRFIWWARVAVTFLRGWWLEAAVVDFLCVTLLVLVPVLAFFAGVADDDCFFLGVDVDMLSCANDAQLVRTSWKARNTAKKRLQVLTLFSVARFSSARV